MASEVTSTLIVFFGTSLVMAVIADCGALRWDYERPNGAVRLCGCAVRGDVRSDRVEDGLKDDSRKLNDHLFVAGGNLKKSTRSRWLLIINRSFSSGRSSVGGCVGQRSTECKKSQGGEL
jgi:hypothetical protein